MGQLVQGLLGHSDQFSKSGQRVHGLLGKRVKGILEQRNSCQYTLGQWVQGLLDNGVQVSTKWDNGYTVYWDKNIDFDVGSRA